MADRKTLVERLLLHRYNTWGDDLGPDPAKKEAADYIRELEKTVAAQTLIITLYEKVLGVQ